ncbi:MAG TPA: Ku protein [Longimicrobiales bacterium]
MELLWRGTLAFGLVQAPIRLYQAVRKRRIEFRLLHEPDRAPIRYLKVCSAEDRAVPDEEVVRGYDVDGGWIVVEDEELHRAAPTLTRSIEIRDFVDLRDIDPIFFRKPYYLAPDEGGEEPYVLMREALRRSGKVGIAQFVLMHREHLAAVRVQGDVLVVQTLYFPEELIPERELELPAEVRLREGDIRMGVELVARLSGDFEPGRYRNEYRERVLEILRQKAEGRLPPELERPTPAPPKPSPVLDLSRRLRESLERVAAERRRRAA